jgi:hypothetical protein
LGRERGSEDEGASLAAPALGRALAPVWQGIEALALPAGALTMPPMRVE